MPSPAYQEAGKFNFKKTCFDTKTFPEGLSAKAKESSHQTIENTKKQR